MGLTPADKALVGFNSHDHGLFAKGIDAEMATTSVRVNEDSD